MKKNRLNSNLPSVIELNGLLSKIGADSNLAKIRQYVSYRSNYLIPNKKFKLQDHSEAMLYRYMTEIEPDVFFDVYLPGYFAFVSPFSILRSFFLLVLAESVWADACRETKKIQRNVMTVCFILTIVRKERDGRWIVS